MFLDASAIVAILASEDGASALKEKLEQAEAPFVYSSASLFEAVVSLARKRTVAIHGAHAPIPAHLFDDVEVAVKDFLADLDAVQVAIDEKVGDAALRAARDFGRASGHPAQLNFGDCLAYGCAKTYGLSLLFKGDDFGRTDIVAA